MRGARNREAAFGFQAVCHCNVTHPRIRTPAQGLFDNLVMPASQTMLRLCHHFVRDCGRQTNKSPAGAGQSSPSAWVTSMHRLARSGRNRGKTDAEQQQRWRKQKPRTAGRPGLKSQAKERSILQWTCEVYVTAPTAPNAKPGAAPFMGDCVTFTRHIGVLRSEHAPPRQQSLG